MAQALTLTNDRHSLGTRALLLAFGLPFFALGLYATVRVILATIDISLGRAFEGSYRLGVAIALAFTVIGGAFVVAFFLPRRDLVFDGDARTLTYTRTFPFDTQRSETFPIAAVPVPETHWVEDTDRTDDGYWVLRVTLPTGRRIDIPFWQERAAKAQASAEAMRTAIRALIEAA